MLARAVVPELRAVLGAALEVVLGGAGPARAARARRRAARAGPRARRTRSPAPPAAGRRRRAAAPAAALRPTASSRYRSGSPQTRPPRRRGRRRRAPGGGLDDVLAGHGYADRVHEEESFPSFPRWRRLVLLDERLARSPVARAGPAHIATLKTFDPPLDALEGRRFAGARRRGKHRLPHRRRRACPARPPDERRRTHPLQAGSEGPKVAGFSGFA